MSNPHEPAAGPAEKLPGRRTFFERFGLWLTVAVGAVATFALGIPLVGYLLGALNKRKADWVSVGRAEGFAIGETRVVTFVNPLRQPWDGMVAKTDCFVCNLGQDEKGKPKFRVLAINCAHLGCPVSWFPQSGLFMCPCHGGVYYETGERASGPPPRGLYHCESQVNKKGELEIHAPHLPTLQDTLTARG
jgi:menaquinol-cytochrome c reductase iron-sulfur subunit